VLTTRTTLNWTQHCHQPVTVRVSLNTVHYVCASIIPFITLVIDQTDQHERCVDCEAASPTAEKTSASEPCAKKTARFTVTPWLVVRGWDYVCLRTTGYSSLCQSEKLTALRLMCHHSPIFIIPQFPSLTHDLLVQTRLNFNTSYS
jgi:hypothetical protein